MMKRKWRQWCLRAVGLFCATMAWSQAKELKDIYVRDPFILPDAGTQTYYLYRSADTVGQAGRLLGGVEVFRSKDLKHWEGPRRVFTVPEQNWITGRVWAPEVHLYQGKYYLFATLNSDLPWKKPKPGWPAYHFRGTQVFWADSPEGPFQPFAPVPHTPMDRMALDGTLWIEEGVPYMVYCHEWVQVVDGRMELVRLKEDLSAAEGPSLTLFHASAAPWSTGSGEGDERSYVTDGCFLYRTKTGKLLMLWSSYMNGQYAVGLAESVTGKVAGPWRQHEQPLFDKDGGHGMLFHTFDGRLCVTFHGSNGQDGAERAQIYEVEDAGDTLVLKQARP